MSILFAKFYLNVFFLLYLLSYLLLISIELQNPEIEIQCLMDLEFYPYPR
jgi:hypothetical protein